MDSKREEELRELYRRELLENVVPFWLTHSLDRVNGGYFNCLDCDGSVYSTDKSMILNNRAVWLYSRLYRFVDPRPEWLGAAKLGYDFLIRHLEITANSPSCMVTQDARPLEPFFFSVEAYGAMASAEYSLAAGDPQALSIAQSLYRRGETLYRTPEGGRGDYVPADQHTSELVVPLLYAAASREIRSADNDPRYNGNIDIALADILERFADDATGVLHETISPNGWKIDSPQGRLIVPGHSIHISWLLMEEGQHRGDGQMVDRGYQLLRSALALGWDERDEGLFNFLDLEGRPTLQLDWDMKLWWVHTEALYATLLAHRLSGNAEFADWYERIHAYTFGHFPDPECGGWFGYLHRDGTLALPAKGSMWKGVFHVASALWQCLTLLDTTCAEEKRSLRS